MSIKKDGPLQECISLTRKRRSVPGRDDTSHPAKKGLTRIGQPLRRYCAVYKMDGTSRRTAQSVGKVRGGAAARPSR